MSLCSASGVCWTKDDVPTVVVETVTVTTADAELEAATTTTTVELATVARAACEKRVSKAMP